MAGGMREKVRNRYAELALASQGGGEAVAGTYDPEAIDGLDTEEGRDALRRVPAASGFVRANKPGGR